MVVAIPVQPLAATVTVVLVLALQCASAAWADRICCQSMTGMKVAGEDDSHWDAVHVSFHQHRIAQQLVGDFSKPVQMFSRTVMVGEDSFRTIRPKYRGLIPHLSEADS